MRAPVHVAALAFAALLSAAPALADLPAPPGYEETCTVARQQKQKQGTECFACAGGHTNPDRCAKLLASTGLAQECKSRGASAWTEVWCRASGGPALPPEAAAQVHAPTAEELAAAPSSPSDKAGASAPPGHSGCGACTAAASQSAAPTGLALLCGLAVLRGIRRGARTRSSKSGR